MERYSKRKSLDESKELSSSSPPPKVNDKIVKQAFLEIDLEELPVDPGLRTRIWDYHPNVREKVRRAYLQKGPSQPRNYHFPIKNISGGPRRFISSWFDEFPTWLEYSIEKDAAYCLCCYLFKSNMGEQGGGECFVSTGFSNWKKKERLQAHVGGPNSAHNQAWSSCQALFKENQVRAEYRILLKASVVCMRFFLRQGLLYCGDGEYEDPYNEDNFLELLKSLSIFNEEIKDATLRNAPLSLTLTSRDTQKDIVVAVTVEIIKAITRDLGDSVFCIVIEELQEMYRVNQMVIVLRFVDKGRVVERFLGNVTATDYTAVAFKVAIDGLFSTHGLNMSKLRGQGYGGKSNMQGELNSLRTLIMKESECAFYVHCFAYDLHSTLIEASYHSEIWCLFTDAAKVVTVVGEFFECRDSLRAKHGDLVSEALNTSDLLIRQGLNEGSSKLRIITSLLSMFISAIDVLEVIEVYGYNSEQRSKAYVLSGSLWSFDFVLSLHMMVNILGITDGLSQALLKKDQGIINATNILRTCKEELQMMMENGWDSLLNQVSSFCRKHEIEVPNMDDMHRNVLKKDPVVTNMHHYHVELFQSIIDVQLKELNDRFSEMNIELLLCVACLNPSGSFSSFDKQKLVHLAQYYPNDFSALDLMILEDQLDKYITDVRSSIDFSGLNGIADLAQKMVETEKDSVYPLVYFLLTLALILPIATPSVERMFTVTKILKNRSSNPWEDQRTEDSWVAYIEKDILDCIDDEVIMQQFQNMKPRPVQL